MRGERSMKKRKAGESLVEVMVAAAIFLMMVSVLQGAITFCTKAQQKSQKIRERNAAVCRDFQTSPEISNGTAAFAFRAVSPDGVQTGTVTLFQVDVQLLKKEVAYTAEDGTIRKADFYLFGGGGGP